MRPQIFASTACLPGVQPLSSRISDLRDHGMSAIELGAGVEVDGDVDTVLARAGAGAQFLIHNYFPPPARSFVLNLASADAAIRQRSMDLVTSALELSQRIGAPFYSVHAGFITDPVGFDGTGFVFPAPESKDAGTRAMEHFIGALDILLREAADRGVKILVENNVCIPSAAGKLLLQSADGFAELFVALPDPNLGMLLDTGHLNVSARTLGFDRTRFVEQVEPHVRAFHVHDNDGTADRHAVVGPDSWVLDVLGRSAFRGLPVVIESKFPNAAALGQHIDWLGRRSVS